jgi:hypothetical protein
VEARIRKLIGGEPTMEQKNKILTESEKLVNATDNELRAVLGIIDLTTPKGRKTKRAKVAAEKWYFSMEYTRDYYYIAACLHLKIDIKSHEFKNDPEKEIKRAYRALARIHHPDREGDPELFKEIDDAYKYCLLVIECSQKGSFDGNLVNGW